MGKTLRESYGKYFSEMMALSHAPDKIDETNIYQEANHDLEKYMNMILSDNFLPGSGLGNIQYFKEFYDKVSKEGKKGQLSSQKIPYGEKKSTQRGKKFFPT